MTRNIVYMCPECRKLVGIKRKDNSEEINYNFEDFEIEHDEMYILYNLDIYFNIRCTCPNCKEEDVLLIELDEGIADIVVEMNEKGYMTEFSCEGHVKDEENYDVAYIRFYVNSLADDIFFMNMIYKSFPSQSWVINRSFIKNIDKSFVEIYMRDSFAKNDRRRKIALDHLKTFVNGLPDLHELFAEV